MKRFQIEAVLKLIPDESSYVSSQAKQELFQHGKVALEYLTENWSHLTQVLKDEVSAFIEHQGRKHLKEAWSSFLVRRDNSALQQGLELLDAYPLSGTDVDFDQCLKDLAGDFVSTGRPIKPLELVDFLVGSGQFSILPNSQLFDIPVQKQFSQLLATHEGTSFSLSCLLILVAHKLGIELRLCAYPDRFLVQIPSGSSQLFVDPAKFGELWGVDRLRFLAHQSDNPSLALRALDQMMSPVEAMDYMLKSWNTQAYGEGQEELGRFLYELMDASKLFQLSGQISSDIPRIFQAGELVRHAQYSYRAVVVDWDTECQASQDWLKSHPGQDLKAEPWYKLLVDDDQRITYVPQSNLVPESTHHETTPLKHPLVQYFFETCPERGYIRNGRLWPH